uniref:Reverse transcriptase Ty1/copia-type domain-containing protein n=1 Tax=Fagus sylvatica TaxID=28930 RepID=A0A2N9EMC6_FAGSY
MLSPALPSRHRQKSGCLRCQEADSSPNRLAATLGSPATGLQSQHLCSRWKDLEKLDPTVQESTPYDVRRAAQSSGAVILGSPDTRLRSRHIHRRWKDLEKTDPTAQDSSSSEPGRAGQSSGAVKVFFTRHVSPSPSLPHFVMAQNEIILKPIHVILDGDNYSLWAQGMCSFLKGRKLWLYVTGQRHPPTPQKDETEDVFALRLEDWDGVNHQIITWLRNNPALNYVVFLAMALKKRGNDDSQADPLPNLFPEIPSPSAESVNPISDESPSADPSSDVSPTTDPTFNESPLSAPAANPVSTTAPEPRRSHRVSTLPSHLRDFHCFSAFATLHEPHTFREASSDPLWQQAMKEELDALLKTGTWDLVDLPAGKSAIGCKWVYKIKTRSDGTVDRYKARLVAKGFTQEYGIDYEETFAPVARLSSVRTLIAVSASRHWPLFQMDVKNAFLNGELTEEVYMQLPPGFSQPPGFSYKVCRLRRALYGLKQAPRAWFAKFSSTISQHGFSASSYDSALFFRRSDHGITLLLLYVDDMIITGDDVQGIQDLKRFLGQHFEMKDLGPLSYFLGLEIADTPIEYNNRLNTHDGEPLPDATLYRQLVGSLVYLTVTRPDISYAVHIVSQFMAAPRSLHYAAVLRILRYLKGTLFHGLHFSSQSSLTLQAYSDADWAGDPTDRHSTTGTEAEYRALADTTAELLWLRWLLQDLGIDCSTAVPIHCDNQSAIQIAHNDVFHERTKHIEIDCHFVRHHLLQGTLQLRSVSSQDQLADIFTKPMPPGRFP